MRTLTITLITALAVLLAACGAAPTASDEVGSSSSDPGQTMSTTTTVAPPTTSVANTTEDQVDTTDDTAGDDGPIVDDTDVLVYFVVEPTTGIDGIDFGCGIAAPVHRRVQSPTVLSGAVEALLAGPTDAEIGVGYGTVLTDEVGWELASATITDGTALIDFTEDSHAFDNMSASCVNLALMAQLETTATQFPTVDRAVFSVGGDIATFYHRLERDVPEV
jgi:hypothetical protein